MDDITMTSIPHLRMVNNDYLADAFFYLAEDRHRAIVKHVTATFNSAYRIITWDILSTQKDTPTLDFKPDFLFTLGSPLSAFLTVRNQSPETYHPDESIVFENIFHPYDPLAYRFEPLLKSDYKHKPAVMVDRCHEGTSTLLQKVMDWYTMALQDTCKGTFLSAFTNNNNKSKKKRARSSYDESGDAKRRRVVLNATCTKGTKTKSTQILKRRIDYCLQPDRIWDAIPYLGGLSAHFSYWQHSDLLWHIVKRMDDVKPGQIECVIKA
ncbi:hypothetical protein K501DRAFT_180579 [Backusella circina FSU 941]|nr:hypothetical protein K501DRAFT_180579 [Backusella circina FSU 941]